MVISEKNDFTESEKFWPAWFHAPLPLPPHPERSISVKSGRTYVSLFKIYKNGSIAYTDSTKCLQTSYIGVLYGFRRIYLLGYNQKAMESINC